MSDRSRTSLTAHIGRMRMDEEPDTEAARDMARNTYIATGGKTVLINMDWLDSWADRKQLDLLAAKTFRVKRML